MENRADKIKYLEEQLEIAMKRQSTLNSNLHKLQASIKALKNESANAPNLFASKKQKEVNATEEDYKPSKKIEPKVDSRIVKESTQPAKRQQGLSTEKSALEKFIGENLISKIGIIILVIGVGIGAKYAIENELISPLTRIMLGYILGAGLLATAFYLKKKYENFSAVILSGAVAIFYIITFLAYSLYELMPQTMAFVLLLVFTVFTVLAAIQYNKQIIAIYGLVGAYAIPFLLSSGDGRYDIFFSFITIVNTGILTVSIAKYWKWLNYTAFGFTWIIFLAWLGFNYEYQHFGLALLFSSIFFIIFYLTFILNKIIKSEKFSIPDVIVIILNTFIYYFIGYGLLSEHESGQYYLGLFTVILAIINFGVSYLFYIKKSADKNLLLFTIGLVLVFITIAIPVQFDGHVVTMAWSGMAVILFWIARAQQIREFEWLAYPVVVIAFTSLLNDWNTNYSSWNQEFVNPILNVSFLSSLIFIGAMAIITFFIYKKKYIDEEKKSNLLISGASFAMPFLLIFATFNVGRLELINYFDRLYNQSLISNESLQFSSYNENILDLKTAWFAIYTLLFAIAFQFISNKWFKNKILSYVTVGVLGFAIVHFLSAGLYSMSELRENYLVRDQNLYFQITWFNIGIRYLGIATVACAIMLLKSAFLKITDQKAAKVVLSVFVYGCILWILSSELIHLISMAKSSIAYKLSLSILWGVYSLFLVSIGIWKEQSYLRIMGISLFTVTLIKLFMYDIAHLTTISKTIVFVALGILLLIVSFLYNKFKHKINSND
ncbi:MAG: DUF2339 domain-containing protein [Crocinitomicaceae bacterium]